MLKIKTVILIVVAVIIGMFALQYKHDNDRDMLKHKEPNFNGKNLTGLEMTPTPEVPAVPTTPQE